MARYTGPVCRLCRREGTKLYLKAERCYTKCPVDKKAQAPGQHGHLRKKPSEYGMQLREKQKVRRIYGVHERQFRKYFREAARKKGVTGEVLLQLLERRLDNVVYRCGFAGSRREARIMVGHGHILVNGRKVDIPSYLVNAGDEIAVKPSSRTIPRFRELAEALKGRSSPEWLEVSPENLTAKVLRLPSREDVDVDIKEHLIVELYSR